MWHVACAPTFFPRWPVCACEGGVLQSAWRRCALPFDLAHFLLSLSLSFSPPFCGTCCISMSWSMLALPPSFDSHAMHQSSHCSAAPCSAHLLCPHCVCFLSFLSCPHCTCDCVQVRAAPASASSWSRAVMTSCPLRSRRASHCQMARCCTCWPTLPTQAAGPLSRVTCTSWLVTCGVPHRVSRAGQPATG